LLAFFAVAVMLLTIMGIYGGVNFLVERRRREIGVRIALGAQRRSIYRLAIQQGMKPVVLAAWPD
jgi:putative ABC transport system permease protein